MQGSVSILNVSPEAAAMIASGGRISTMDGTAGEIYAKSLAAGQEKPLRWLPPATLLWTCHLGTPCVASFPKGLKV